jgi:hypothetical protein
MRRRSGRPEIAQPPIAPRRIKEAAFGHAKTGQHVHPLELRQPEALINEDGK